MDPSIYHLFLYVCLSSIIYIFICISSIYQSIMYLFLYIYLSMYHLYIYLYLFFLSIVYLSSICHLSVIYLSPVFCWVCFPGEPQLIQQLRLFQVLKTSWLTATTHSLPLHSSGAYGYRYLLGRLQNACLFFVLFSFLHCRGSRMSALGEEKFTLGFVEGSI